MRVYGCKNSHIISLWYGKEMKWLVCFPIEFTDKVIPVIILQAPELVKKNKKTILRFLNFLFQISAP